MRALLRGGLLTLALLPALASTQGTNVMAGVGIDQKLGERVATDAMFTDENGRSVFLSEMLGEKPTLLVPIFYDCKGTCLLVTEGLVKTLRDLGEFAPNKEFNIVTISIRPKETTEDAAAKKKTIFEQYGRSQARDGWHFLTGDMTNIRKVTDSVGFHFTYDEKKDLVRHPAAIFVLTKDGRVSQVLYGVEYPSQLVKRSVETAAKDELGFVANPILLGCVMADPITGEYRLNTERAMKVGGALVLLTLGVSIFFMERRRKLHHGEGAQS
ncbi:MAG: SCO family protein [Fimbriimonadaceae bacterium]